MSRDCDDDEARAALAARQAALAHALTERADVPAGFDPARVEKAQAALAHKKERERARAHALATPARAPEPPRLGAWARLRALVARV